MTNASGGKRVFLRSFKLSESSYLEARVEVVIGLNEGHTEPSAPYSIYVYLYRFAAVISDQPSYALHS